MVVAVKKTKKRQTREEEEEREDNQEEEDDNDDGRENKIRACTSTDVGAHTSVFLLFFFLERGTMHSLCER